MRAHLTQETAATDADMRRRAMLRTAMGPAIAAALADPHVVEIMVNADGALRLDSLGEGRADTEVQLGTAEVERIIRLVASHARAEIPRDHPIVSAELPSHGAGAGERFEGLLPPVSLGPCFSIRKPAARIYTLADYAADGVMTDAVAQLLRQAVVDRHNILVPVNATIQRTIHRIADGELRPGLELLRRIYDDTRAPN